MSKFTLQQLQQKMATKLSESYYEIAKKVGTVDVNHKIGHWEVNQ